MSEGELDLRVPRRAAGIVYNASFCGLCAPSAEALATDSKSAAMTYNIFETATGSNEARTALVADTVRPALRGAAKRMIVAGREGRRYSGREAPTDLA